MTKQGNRSYTFSMHYYVFVMPASNVDESQKIGYQGYNQFKKPVTLNCVNPCKTTIWY